MTGLELAMLLGMIGGGAMNGISSSKSNSRNREQNQAMSEMELALRESELNPFRGQNAQARSLMAMDRAVGTTPTTVAPSGSRGYNSLQGGQYTMSPEMIEWMTELRNRIASGVGRNQQITPSRFTVQPFGMNLNPAQPHGPAVNPGGPRPGGRPGEVFR